MENEKENCGNDTGACLCDRNICTGKCMGSTGDGRSIHAEREENPIHTKSIQCCKESVWGYIPSEKVSKKELKERYGISSKWYSAAIAEVPMISANADTLVIVKAKNAASKKKIRSALKKYREELIQDTCQYPMNQLKIQASKVYV